MSSEPRKVVNLDRPHEGSADVERPEGIAAKDEVDRLLSDFLEHINSLAAEYESSGEPPTELTPEVAAEPVAETIANIAAAIQDQPPPAAPEPAPLPFGRDTAELDEEIERALSALEELPVHPEGEPAEARQDLSAAVPPVPELAAGTGLPSVESGPPPDVGPTDVVEEPEVKEIRAPAPAAASPDSGPLFTYSPTAPGRRRMIIGLAIVGAAVLLAFVIYLLATRSRAVSPGVGAQTAAAPAQMAAVGDEQPTSSSANPQPEASGVQDAAEPDVDSSIQPVWNSGGAKEVRTRAPRSGANPSAARSDAAPAPREAQIGESREHASSPTVAAQVTAPVIENTQRPAPPPVHEAVQPPSIPASSLASGPQPQQVAATQPVPAESGHPTLPSASPAAPANPSPAPGPGSQPGPTSAVPPKVSPAPARTSQPEPSRAVQNATPAELVSKVLPAFPDFARRMNQTGRVDLEIEIDAQGKVTKARPVTGPAVFHMAAIEAVKQWRFKPATLNGERVASQGRVTVVFDKR